MKILVTGSAGFIAGYLVAELLDAGYEVVGVDDFSKYSTVEKSYDRHSRYHFQRGDARDPELLKKLVADCEVVIALAAKIGGISYFHRYAYDILSANERIVAATFDAALAAHRAGSLRRMVVVSSSMVFENATEFPTPEGHERVCPPPTSAYGFQKLASEYFARAAQKQYGLPFTIVRPFNCVGIGESRALGEPGIPSGNIRLAMSHVVPDLCQKVLKGQDPLHILGSGDQVRHYTYGGDLARGIRLALESPAALNEDFNLSTARSTTVKELAELIWRKIRPNAPLRLVHDPPFEHDIARRVPATEKAKRLLGFEATTSIEAMLDEVIPWVTSAIEAGIL